MSHYAPRSIEQYMSQLAEALVGEDPAVVQDALYDSEEYLRAEVAAHPEKSEADVLEYIASSYGAPDEVADAYRNTEAAVRKALATPGPPTSDTTLGRFFSVMRDGAWCVLRPYGGIRIEDDVYISTKKTRNLTREAFAQQSLVAV